MVNKSLMIGLAILVIVFLGFVFVSNMTGNVITGSISTEKVVENELFQINEINETTREETNDTQNNSESR